MGSAGNAIGRPQFARTCRFVRNRGSKSFPANGMNYINREHPDYAAQKATWRKYKDLYAGGERMRQNASEYLVRRGREPGDVYAERLSRVFYENYA